MPLIRKKLVPIRIFKMKMPDVDSPDFYPGQAPGWTYSRTEMGNVQPVESKVTSEVYGERVYNMFSLIFPSSSRVDESVRLSFSGKDKATYKPVAIKRYSDHITVLAEKVTSQ